MVHCSFGWARMNSPQFVSHFNQNVEIHQSLTPVLWSLCGRPGPHKKSETCFGKLVVRGLPPRLVFTEKIFYHHHTQPHTQLHLPHLRPEALTSAAMTWPSWDKFIAQASSHGPPPAPRRRRRATASSSISARPLRECPRRLDAVDGRDVAHGRRMRHQARPGSVTPSATAAAAACSSVAAAAAANAAAFHDAASSSILRGGLLSCLLRRCRRRGILKCRRRPCRRRRRRRRRRCRRSRRSRRRRCRRRRRCLVVAAAAAVG